ncbi:flagellar biosynthesis protein FlhA [uncultured Umboniibacter sp.]|uniref:flagellar biosynthesis protein FlhA n=1 Tax=uncultured Umboniibacter sp. TaxID=1798917 RepID=UPI002611D99C|nr:flagellar biosynthesis protein FlhA [uncultured Umboniibacter sp.]
MESIFNQLRKIDLGLLAIPLVLLAIIAMIVLPLPPILLDIFFTFNIVLAITILLVSTSVKRPLDFSMFPTILLIATLLRLTLNVASTRVVLLNGHLGSDAAGKVIQSFGEVVIAGNYVVGLVIFIILMIINFVVITKGGERISEVGARFTLDAMPGKQMAIDADLNAGIIDQQSARERRKEIASEADFYGSMDGASKFVRGDAVAGLLILAINIIGGISIGVFEYDMSGGDAFKTYVLLTIGDGLVAQIPSLLLATSAAIIVTRVGDDDREMSESVGRQLLAKPKTLFIVAGIMATMGSVPGMPHLAFFTFALVVGFTGWQLSKLEQRDSDELLEAATAEQHSENDILDWSIVTEVQVLRIELGYRLVPLVNPDQGAPLLKRLKGVRKSLSDQVGFLIPEVSISDNLGLKPNEYKIYVNGERREGGALEIDQLMAIPGANILGEIDGQLTEDPAYQLPAYWITEEQRTDAINLGYQVVEDATIISTHVAKIIKSHLADIFHHEDVVALNERLQQISPSLADALAEKVPFSDQLQIFKNLLSQQLPIKDLRRIATTLIQFSDKAKEPSLVAAEVRVALRNTIIELVNGEKSSIDAFTLSAALEGLLNEALQQARREGQPLDDFTIDSNLVTQFQQNLPLIKQQMREAGLPPVLLVPANLRGLIARYASIFSQGLVVLSYREIPETLHINIVGNLG